mgnify:CR=1 FL=1
MTGNCSKTVRIIEIAELLGVSKQRAHQIADEDGFPVPVAEDVRGRFWDRREVDAWIEAKLAEGRQQCQRDAEKFARLGQRSVAARRAKREAAMQAAV